MAGSNLIPSRGNQDHVQGCSLQMCCPLLSRADRRTKRLNALLVRAHRLSHTMALVFNNTSAQFDLPQNKWLVVSTSQRREWMSVCVPYRMPDKGSCTSVRSHFNDTLRSRAIAVWGDVGLCHVWETGHPMSSILEGQWTYSSMQCYIHTQFIQCRYVHSEFEILVW